MVLILCGKGAPSAIGPYSQATKTGNLVFASGCIPLDPETMEVVSGGIEEQTVSRTLNHYMAYDF